MIFTLFVSSCNSEKKEYYRNEINQLESELSQLESEINNFEFKYAQLLETYTKLKLECDEIPTFDEMLKWLNVCNVNAVRSNFKLKVYSYNEFLFIKTETYTTTGSAVLVETNTTDKYLITTYALVKHTNDYDKTEITLVDAFENEYSGNLIHMSSSYHLAIIKIDSSNDRHYCIPVATNNPIVNDPICNIYYHENGIYNYMNFSYIKSYKDESLDFKVIYNECENVNTVYGGMCVDFNGKLCGVIIYTYESGKHIGSVPSNVIRKYLQSRNLI